MPCGASRSLVVHRGAWQTARCWSRWRWKHCPPCGAQRPPIHLRKTAPSGRTLLHHLAGDHRADRLARPSGVHPLLPAPWGDRPSQAWVAAWPKVVAGQHRARLSAVCALTHRTHVLYAYPACGLNASLPKFTHLAGATRRQQKRESPERGAKRSSVTESAGRLTRSLPEPTHPENRRTIRSTGGSGRLPDCPGPPVHPGAADQNAPRPAGHQE